MSKIFALFLVLLQLIAICLGQNSCPSNIQALDSFDAARFAGTWHLYAYVADFLAFGQTSCQQAMFVYNEARNFLDGILAFKLNGIRDTSEMTFTPKGNSLVHIKTRFHDVDVKFLDLVYDDYAILYFCGANPHVWVATRATNPDAAKMNGYIQNAVLQFGEDFSKDLTIQDHMNCY